MDRIISKIEPHELEIIAQYLTDYKRKLHVREIARLLQATQHRTTALTLQKLEKKKIVISETVGKNKFYFPNIQNIITGEYISCSESLQKMKLLEKHFFLKKLVTEISPILEDSAFVLFGSYAKGKETKDSDVDLLLFKGHNERILTAKIKGFAKQYHKTIQIQQTTQKQFEAGLREKDPLVIEIANHHILLNNNQFFIGMLWRYAHER